MPPDISLYYAEDVDEEFHPRYDVKKKEYLYRIRNSVVNDPFDFARTWFLPRNIDENALKMMQDAAKHFIGYHDFSAFMSEGSDVLDTHRTVFDLSVERCGEYIDVRISADGFLYNMVRIIVGTLVSVAFGRIDPDEIPDVIASGDRSRAGMTAPADGLYLNKVFY